MGMMYDKIPTVSDVRPSNHTSLTGSSLEQQQYNAEITKELSAARASDERSNN
jgi:hypothetical protein